MCSGAGLQKRFKESLKPEREFKRSLKPEDAFHDSMEPISGPRDAGVNVPDPIRPPKEARAPDESIFSRRNKRGAAGQASNVGTLLTGPSGVVSSPIGTSTLLGG